MRMRMTWRCGRDPEAGSVLVFWGIAIVVLLGMVALSFDVGRISATQSELQSFADNLAVAAAAELDGEADSIDRAIAAAETLITDTQSFGAGGRQLTTADIDWDFFQGSVGAIGSIIDPDDGYSTSEQASAGFVRADVGPRNVGTPFAAVLALITGDALVSANVSAQATAGMDEYACDISPLFFCVPSGWDAETEAGKMVMVRSGGQNDTWGPGNFGFLDPDLAAIAPNSPCNALKNDKEKKECLIAAEGALTRCFNPEGVDTEPGQRTGSNASLFNVFFDIYEASMNNQESRPDNLYPPAPNVIRGFAAQNSNQPCNMGNYVDSATRALPRDNCLASATPSCTPNARFGNGQFSFDSYITANHGGIENDPRQAFSFSGKLKGSRYEMYLAEIEAAAGGSLTIDPEETGRPICNPRPSTNKNRRVLTVAAIVCDSADNSTKFNNAKSEVQGRAKGVKVEEFVRVFLTEPVGMTEDGTKQTGSQFDIVVEILGTAEKDTEVGPATVRRVVRLTE